MIIRFNRWTSSFSVAVRQHALHRLMQPSLRQAYLHEPNLKCNDRLIIHGAKARILVSEVFWLEETSKKRTGNERLALFHSLLRHTHCTYFWVSSKSKYLIASTPPR